MIVASHVERMLKGAVEQTVKSKGRLDDPGIIEGSMLANDRLFEGNACSWDFELLLFYSQLERFWCSFLLPLLKGKRLFPLLLCKLFKRLDHELAASSKRLANQSPVNRGLHDSSLARFLVLLPRHERHVRRLRVHLEVETRSICMPHYLHPAVGAENLRVPAVLRVMRHLCCPVLPESNGLDSTLPEKLLRLTKEVGQSLVDDDSILHCLPECSPTLSFSSLLRRPREKTDLHVCHLAELDMSGFSVGKEMLDLSHFKLTLS
mmetsp:Transcript_9286/g.31033  ORF Transcript_9286/g.31033 Transcript_9286/m.31033 type:complete len:263 (+) Transcript_9286:4046-4834(+)